MQVVVPIARLQWIPMLASAPIGAIATSAFNDLAQ
jgi:hypothetical protein